MLGRLGHQYCCGGLQRDCFYEECPGRSAGLFYAVLHNLLVIVIAPDHLLTRKSFAPVGIPGCKPGATLVPETRVAVTQHIYSFQAEPVPTSPAVS